MGSVTGNQMHFCLKVPMKNCRLMVAKMQSVNAARARTQESLFIEWTKLSNVFFRPERRSVCENRHTINVQTHTHRPGNIGKVFNIRETVFSSGKCTNSERNLKHRKRRQNVHTQSTATKKQPARKNKMRTRNYNNINDIKRPEGAKQLKREARR